MGHMGDCQGVAVQLLGCSVWLLGRSGGLLTGLVQKSPPPSLHDILVPRYGSGLWDFFFFYLFPVSK